MRKVIKDIYNPFLQFYFTLKLKSYIASHSSQKFLILDIDNTIADTWKHLEDFKKNRKKFFLNLPLLKGTIKYINENYNDLPIVFISNRSIFDIETTKVWLTKNGFSVENNLLILTNNPKDKIGYLKQLAANCSLVYFDDLSYNHENNKVLFYEDVIQEVKKMDIQYYDYQFIQNLNS